MNHSFTRHNVLLTITTSVAAILAGCTPTTAPTPSATAAPPTAGSPSPVPAAIATPAAPMISRAANARDYRHDAAHHIYAKNANRIFKGQLPAMLYAIGVLQVEVDSKGRVTGTHWMRAPKHAPEVMAEIERTVRLAAPYPIPARMGHVTYTDTWLWDKSGHFQLDTLTEGQL